MSDFEKLGAFYIGREYDPAKDALAAEPLMYDSRDLTTHGVCVGMTGSGKTGLCIGLLEEAAIDGIPAIVIDPKGDLANLLLTFPDLTPADFRPWIDGGEAARKGVSRGRARCEDRRDGGRRASPTGARTASASGSSASPWTSRSTRPAARPACRCRSCVPSRRRLPGQRRGQRSCRHSGPDFRGRLRPAGPRRHRGRSAEEPRAHPACRPSSMRPGARAMRSISRASSARSRSRRSRRSASSTSRPSIPRRTGSNSRWRSTTCSPRPASASGSRASRSTSSACCSRRKASRGISIVSIAHLTDAERMFFVTLLLNELVAWMRRQSGTPACARCSTWTRSSAISRRRRSRRRSCRC